MHPNVISYDSVLVGMSNGALNCPDQFEPVGGECILASSDREMSWYEADWFCRRKNSRLYQPSDELLQENLVNFLSLKGFSHPFWVGGYKNEGHWQWIEKSHGQNITDFITE